MIPILPARLDWPSAVGNFILNFGSLDWHVFAFLEKRLSLDQFARIKSEPFQERVARVRKLVATGQFSAERKQAFEGFFTRLEQVRLLRNRIAHGHLHARITDLGKLPILTLSLPKDLDSVDAPETLHLKFEELVAAQTELAALIDEFQQLSADWSIQTWKVEMPSASN